MEQYIEFSQEVITAKQQGKPIVALESTIISHGMPYPQNVKMAKQLKILLERKVPSQQQ